jgi:hypothetical protein
VVRDSWTLDVAASDTRAHVNIGMPARETLCQFASWMHLSPPRLVVYVRAFTLKPFMSCNVTRPGQMHTICTVDPGPCKSMFDAVDREMAIKSGQPYKPGPVIPKGDIVFPLLAACAGCKKDSTADLKTPDHSTLMRCSACKVTRYCG